MLQQHRRSFPLFGLVLVLFVMLAGKINCGEQFPMDGSLETENKRAAFYVGSRYGRSDGGSPVHSPLPDEMMPRVERFYLSSRYGKRQPQFEAVEGPSNFLTCVSNGKMPGLYACSPLEI